MAIEEGAFRERGIELKWKDVPEGTGKMSKMLALGEAELAIILTEGIVKSITEGNPVKIVQEYIATPLYWGIHVAANSRYQTLADLENKTVAISRYGSGSHLMSFVNANNHGWSTSSLKFELVNTLDGAIEALNSGKADYFMWEHFTTKPIVDAGIFRRLGDCPTPWPCFVIAANDTFLTDHKNILGHILEVINMYTSEFKLIPSIDRTLSNKYGQLLEDVQEWLSMTEWSQSQLNVQTLQSVQECLLELGLINRKLNSDEMLTN
jgi:ABC-type nitrate/sulfonate/bicarbonate transport system substrate-binding protein